MAARRCSTCSTDWPTKYTVCPECQTATWIHQNGDPIPDADALKRRRYADFEREYAEREEKRKREPGYVPPELDARLDEDREPLPAPGCVDWDSEISGLLDAA